MPRDKKMRFLFSEKAWREYAALETKLQKTAEKQFSLLLRNIRHSSLRAKKYDENRNIWQARLTREWRFYFQIHEDVYRIITIIKHPK